MAAQEEMKLTIRLPDDVARRVQDEAERSGLPPTTVVQLVVARHYRRGANHASGITESAPPRIANGAKPARQPAGEPPLYHAARGLVASAVTPEQCFKQLVYEIAKTRSAFLHFTSHTLAEEQIAMIARDAERDGKDYANKLFELLTGEAAGVEGQGDAEGG